jgi:hypothetical protein
VSITAATDATLGSVAAGSFDVDATGALTLTNVTAGATTLTGASISATGDLATSDLTATATNALSLAGVTATGAVSLASTEGSVSTTGSLSAVEQTVSITAATEATLEDIAAETVTVNAAQAVTLGSVVATEGVSTKAGTRLSFSEGATVTGGAVDLTASEALVLPAISATGLVTAESTAGGITVNPSLDIAAEVTRLLAEETVAVPAHEGSSLVADALSLKAAGDVFLAEVAVQGDLAVQAEGALLLANGSELSQESGRLSLIASGDMVLSNISSQGERIELQSGGKILGQPTEDDVGTLLSTPGHIDLQASNGIGAEGLKRLRLDAGSVSARNLVEGDLILFGVDGLAVAEPGVRSEAEDDWVALLTEQGTVENRNLVTALSNRVLIKEGVAPETDGFLRGGLASAFLVNGAFDQAPKLETAVDLQAQVQESSSALFAAAPRAAASSSGTGLVAEELGVVLRDAGTYADDPRVKALGGLTSMLELVQLSGVVPLDSQSLISGTRWVSESTAEGEAPSAKPLEEQGDGEASGTSEARDDQDQPAEASDADSGDGETSAADEADAPAVSLWRGTWERMLAWLDRQTLEGMTRAPTTWQHDLPELVETAPVAAPKPSQGAEASAADGHGEGYAQVEVETSEG